MDRCLLKVVDNGIRMGLGAHTGGIIGSTLSHRFEIWALDVGLCAWFFIVWV